MRAEKEEKIGNLLIREATYKDFNHIWEIEKSSYKSPWPKETFYIELSFNKDAKYYVAIFNNKIVGFVGAWLKDFLHIVNVAVHPQHRGVGIGKILMIHILKKGREAGLKKAFLEVRKSNIVALNMYLSLGFKIESVKENYYLDNHEDALVLSREDL